MKIPHVAEAAAFFLQLKFEYVSITALLYCLNIIQRSTVNFRGGVISHGFTFKTFNLAAV